MKEKNTTLDERIPEHSLIKKVTFMVEMKGLLRKAQLLSTKRSGTIDEIIEDYILLYMRGVNVSGNFEDAIKKKKKTNLDKNNSEELLVYQLVDFTEIKLRGELSMDIDKEMAQVITRVAEGFIWLYMKGLNLSRNPKEVLHGEDLEYYEESINAFSVFQDFMRTHMHLAQ